jgi:hypothetical protein
MSNKICPHCKGKLHFVMRIGRDDLYKCSNCKKETLLETLK